LERIRCKIHKTNNKGYMQASVTASIQPISYPNISSFSLDDTSKIPINLEIIN